MRVRLQGARSGLLKHIIRLVDELKSIDVIFMENSPRILLKGFDEIKKLFMQRGYKVKYCLIEAKDVGAPHKRSRWYCLCYKPNVENKLKYIDDKETKYNFNKLKTIKKVLPKSTKIYNKNAELRCQCLGNSVVPQCVMVAWNNRYFEA